MSTPKMKFNTPPYVVEVEQNGCEHCGQNKYWTVVFTPEDVALGQSWGEEEAAEDVASMLNDAYEKGWNAGKASPVEKK